MKLQNIKVIVPSVAVYSLLFLIFIIEGLGLPEGRVIARYVICTFPIIFFGIDLFYKNRIIILLKISLLFVLFSIVTAFSTISAINIETAFNHQLYYLAIFLNFIYIYNHQNQLKLFFPRFITICTILIFLYTIFINWFLPNSWWPLIPTSGYQFVYFSKDSGAHYSYGGFLLIPLILSFSSFYKKPRLISGFLFFTLLLFFIGSFLRSAYLAFIGVMVLISLQRILQNKKIIYTPFILGIVLLFLFFAITRFNTKIPFISSLNNNLIDHFKILEYKSIDNGRIDFMKQAIQALEQKPLLGFGSYNFYYASMRFAKNYDAATGTSHNMFLDIFVENGIAGGIIFGLLILFLIKNISSNFIKKDIADNNIFYIFIAILILFQFGHYHKFYFLFLFFFFSAGLLYSEKVEFKNTYNLTFIGSIVLALINLLIITSFILFKTNHYKAAVIMYPLSVNANELLVYDYYDEKSYKKVQQQISYLYSLYPEEPYVLDFIGNFYRNIQLPTESIQYTKKALQYVPKDITYLISIYDDLEKIKGRAYAKSYVEDYISKYKLFKNGYWDSNAPMFYSWCSDKKINCSSK